jgi:Phage-related minor tail protein
MASDEERLVVLLEARIRDFEKNMQKASGTADKSYSRMRRDSRSATKQMETDMVKSTSRINQALATSATKIGSYGKAFIGGLAGGFLAGGVVGIVGQLGQVANAVATIGDEAKRAGVSAKAFQEWKFVAEQNRIGIDQMVDGLKELNLRADEFVLTGKGSAAEAFQRLGYSAADLKKKLEDPSALLLEIIGRLGKLDRAAQIRIADEIFGGSAGERFVELIDQGEQGLRDTIDRAHELGVVMDDDVIKKAAELDRKFNEVATTVGTTLKTAIVEAATALQNFINSFQSWYERHQKALRTVESGRMFGAMADPNRPAPGTSGRPTVLDARMNGEPVILSDDDEALVQKLQDRYRKTTDSWKPISPTGGSTRNRAAEQAEREAEAVRRLIAELQEELRLVGATDTEKQISATLRRANIDAASAEGQQIAELVRQIEAETEALQKNKEQQEQRQEALQGLFDMGGDALMSIVDGSMKAEDALKRLVVQLALAAAQAALLGTGPLAGLFNGGLFPNANGNAFSGGSVIPFATGGVVGGPTVFPMSGGRVGLMGEAGPEAIMPLKRGSNGKLGVVAEGGGPAVYSPTFNIDARGSSNPQETRQIVEQSLKEYSRGDYQRWVSNFHNAKKRNLQ